jgi:hypothetical protein
VVVCLTGALVAMLFGVVLKMKWSPSEVEVHFAACGMNLFCAY